MDSDTVAIIIALVGVIILAAHGLSVEMRFNALHRWLHRDD